MTTIQMNSQFLSEIDSKQNLLTRKNQLPTYQTKFSPIPFRNKSLFHVTAAVSCDLLRKGMILFYI